MKSLFLLFLLTLGSAFAYGQAQSPGSVQNSSGTLSGTGGAIGTCYPTASAGNPAGSACLQFVNSTGAFSATFEEVPSGVPTTVSISIYGCMRSGTCDTVADNNTSTSAVNRGVTFSKVYDVWVVVSITLTGGTNPTEKINLKGSTANNHTGGGSFTAAGDLSGSSSSQNVIGIESNLLPALSTGFLNWTGSAWAFSASGSGTVTSVGQTVPSWLSVAGSPVTGSGTLAVTPATGQTSHQVIGTCNTATTFAPCALVAGDIPAPGGDVSGTYAATVVGKINGTSMAGLATGIVKNTTATGVPSIAVAGDFPTLNQNTTGSAAKWTTARTLAGNSVDGSANVTFANKFIVQGTTDAGLSAAQFLGALSTGLLKNTTTTGVLSIGAAADVYGLFTGCTGSSGFFLEDGGTCAAPSGSGTVNSGTATHLSYYASSTNAVSNDATATDDGTTLTYSGTGGITASAGKVQSSSDGTHTGGVAVIGNTTEPTLPSNSFVWGGPLSASFTAFGWNPPTAENGSAGILHIGAASSHWSALTVSALALTDMATQAANTTLANVAGSTATPTAATIPAGIQNYVSGTGYNQATGHQIQTPGTCADSSGSGTAQSCNTSPTFTPASPDCIVYTTTTTNSGAGLTINVNSLGAKSIAIPGPSGWATTLTASIIPANKPLLACYDGTNWNVQQTGTAAAGGGGSYTLMGTNAVAYAVSPEYVQFPGNVAGATTQASTAASIISTAQTIDTMYVHLSVATAAASSVTYTLYYGTSLGSMTATLLTCTIGAAATDCSDLTHSFTTAAGSYISVQITYTGTPGSTAGNSLSVKAH